MEVSSFDDGFIHDARNVDEQERDYSKDVYWSKRAGIGKSMI